MMSIVLLNFLIAMINQQFEEALSKLEITQTKHKAELNEQYFINREYGNRDDIKRGRIYILQMNTKFEAEDQQ